MRKIPSIDWFFPIFLNFYAQKYAMMCKYFFENMQFNTEFEVEIIKWGLEINEIIKIIKISKKKTIQKFFFENKFSIDWFYICRFFSRSFGKSLYGGSTVVSFIHWFQNAIVGPTLPTMTSWIWCRESWILDTLQ